MSITTKNNRIIGQDVLRLRSKFGDPSLNRWWHTDWWTHSDGQFETDILRQTGRHWRRQRQYSKVETGLEQNKFKSKMHIWFPQNAMEEAQGRADALQQLLQEDGQRRSDRRVLSEDARFRQEQEKSKTKGYYDLNESDDYLMRPLWMVERQTKYLTRTERMLVHWQFLLNCLIILGLSGSLWYKLSDLVIV